MAEVKYPSRDELEYKLEKAKRVMKYRIEMVLKSINRFKVKINKSPKKGTDYLVHDSMLFAEKQILKRLIYDYKEVFPKDKKWFTQRNLKKNNGQKQKYQN